MPNILTITDDLADRSGDFSATLILEIVFRNPNHPDSYFLHSPPNPAFEWGCN